MRTFLAFVVLVLVPLPASSQETHPGTASATSLDLLGPVRPPVHRLAVPLLEFPRSIPAVEAASPFLVGIVGSVLASGLWMKWGPNWDDADRGEEREDLGWYVGPLVGGPIGVWIEGARKRQDGSLLALFAGGTTGLLLGALHAESTNGESVLSYAALGILPPLGATIGWALTADPP